MQCMISAKGEINRSKRERERNGDRVRETEREKEMSEKRYFACLSYVFQDSM